MSINNDGTYNGELTTELVKIVEKAESKSRKEVRPLPKDESPSYWYPKYQEWMTLNQYEYRKTAEKSRK